MSDPARRPRSKKGRSRTDGAATAASKSRRKTRTAPSSAPKSTESSASVSSGKAGRPTDYRPEMAEQAFKLCLLGATDRDLAGFFDVSEQTINAWKQAQPEFLESIKGGKERADAEVANSLYRRALGYSHPAVKIITVSQGANAGSVVEQVPYTEHYPPDTAAGIFWLKNRKKAAWRDRIDHANDPDNPMIASIIVVPKKDVATASPLAAEPEAG